VGGHGGVGGIGEEAMPGELLVTEGFALVPDVLSIVDMVGLDEIDDAEAVHKLFDSGIEEVALDLFEDGLHLVEDVVDSRKCFL
jgi:hypothetical protein